MSTRGSAVLDFTGVAAGVKTGSFILDWEKNRDSDGNEKTSFLPLDTVYLLFQPAQGAGYDRMFGSIEHGRIVPLGEVLRTVEEDVQFTPDKPSHAVQHRPYSNVAKAVFDGNAPQLFVNSSQGSITATEPIPAIGVLSYQSQFLSFRFTPPTSLGEKLKARQDKLGDNEQAEFKVLMVAYDA